jgi:uncharacterized radical SAM superfamily Fe-S cluster-containing enzyme
MGQTALKPFFASEAEGIPLGLPRRVESLCPECLRVIGGELMEREGRVFLRKECPLHGSFEELVAGNAKVFAHVERYAVDGSVKLQNTPVEKVGACPTDCGLCQGHLSSASMTILDLTNRCNLRCPYCFANANVQPYVYEPELDEIRAMMDRALAVRPKRMQAIQFSGGEPTLSRHFLEACRLAKERGIKMIQAATNGIRFAQEPGFAEKAAEAGLNAAYLQFDGVSDDIYEITRGVKGLWPLKLKAMEAFRRAGIRVTLVPTVIKGVNDHQVGDILRFAIQNLDVVVGVAPQPVAFTGRVDEAERAARRYTSSDLAVDIERQTGLLVAERDFFPFSITALFGQIVDNVLGEDPNGFLPMVCNSHPDCGVSAYLLVNQDTGASVPVNELFDIDRTLRLIQELGAKSAEHRSRLFATAQFFSILLKTFRPERAPEGLHFLQLAKTIDAISGKRIMGIAKKSRYPWRLLLIASMHFMDSYNFQVDRVKRCTIHYSAPDGRIYPFCTYNSGRVFRTGVEQAYSVPKEEWLRSRGGRYVTEGFVGE